MEDDEGNARHGEGNAVAPAAAAVVHLSPVATSITPDASTGLASTSHQTSSPPSPCPSLNKTKAAEEALPSPSTTQEGSSISNHQQQNNNTNPGRRSLPFSFPPLFFRSNTSSTSLAPSTAEGKPIPVDDTTAAHRISALKKLTSPAAGGRGHTYAKSAGAQSSTYSQPVLVRTYSGPSPQSSYGGAGGFRSPKHQQGRSSRYRPPSSSRGVSRRVPLPLSSKSGTDLSSRPTKPALSGGASLSVGNGSNGHGSNLPSSRLEGVTGTSSTNSATSERLSNMPHHHSKSKKSTGGSSITSGFGSKLPLSWVGQWKTGGDSGSKRGQDEAKLPPLEAFSFKSFMADLPSPSNGESDIGADLDRIAEICARSRYSLSSQYEMHVAPHGSGISFISGGGGSRRNKGYGHTRSTGSVVGGNGPTLQAINSDDDNESARSHHQRGKRRSGGAGAGRRRSVAYGTLETIMSSSRSSEEDKTKKKSAAEIVGEVRGRAARKAGWQNSASTGTGSGDSNSNSNSNGTNTTTQGEAGSQGGVGNTDADARSKGQSQSQTSERAKAKLARKKSASFATAVIHNNHQHHDSKNDVVTPTSSASALISEPAMPQTSMSHLGVRTASAAIPAEDICLPPSPGGGQVEVHLADELPHQIDPVEYSHQVETSAGRAPSRSLSGYGYGYGYSHAGAGAGGGWSTWIPRWSTTSTTTTNNTSSNIIATVTTSNASGVRGGTGADAAPATRSSTSSSHRGSGNKTKSGTKTNAEGSLRQLLKSV